MRISISARVERIMDSAARTATDTPYDGGDEDVYDPDEHGYDHEYDRWSIPRTNLAWYGRHPGTLHYFKIDTNVPYEYANDRQGVEYVIEKNRRWFPDLYEDI